jgi:hypothetical protein
LSLVIDLVVESDRTGQSSFEKGSNAIGCTVTRLTFVRVQRWFSAVWCFPCAKPMIRGEGEIFGACNDRCVRRIEIH